RDPPTATGHSFRRNGLGHDRAGWLPRHHPFHRRTDMKTRFALRLAASVTLLAALALPATAGPALDELSMCQGRAARTFALSTSEPAATVAQAAIGHCLDKEPAARQEIVTSSGLVSNAEAQRWLDERKRDPSHLISIIMELRSHRGTARKKAQATWYSANDH